MWAAVALWACVPVLEDPTPYVDRPRVLAVRATPAEVAPGAEVELDAWVVGPDGPVPDAELSWAACLERKPLAELGPVAPACLDAGDPALAPAGEGRVVTTTLAQEVCALFGPYPPLPREGQPAGRPVDADPTGGYHAPFVVFPPDEPPVIGAVRARCGLADVSQETSIAWNQAYVSNTAPRAAALELDGAPLGETPFAALAGAEYALEVQWPECASAPCDGAEPYVLHDRASDALLDVREGLSATWYTGAGTLADARSGRAPDDPETRAGTTWTAPDTPGLAWIGVVLRDDRGGVDVRGGFVEVGR